MGGIKYKNLAHLAKEIWQWCEKRNIWLFASYIASSENYEADKASRTQASLDTEWSLSQSFFKQIISEFGHPDIDLFASSFNHKCKKYVSWKPDPDSLAVDAFTLQWNKFTCFYAFPPFSLILRTLNKVIADKAEGILVVPWWPSQPWYPLFEKLKQKEIYLGPNDNLLFSPFRDQHPLAKSLILVAAKLSPRALSKNKYPNVRSIQC